MKRMLMIPFVGVALATLCWAGVATAAPTDEQLCLAAKEKILSKYEQCVWKAHAKSTQTGAALDTSLCQSKFDEQWVKPNAKYGMDCPATTAATISSLFSGHVSDVLALITTTATACGNGTIEGGEQCDGTSLGGATCSGLGYGNTGTLACSGTCAFDSSGCDGCSVFAQDCPVGSDSCQLSGGGSTACAPPGTGTEGQECDVDGCAESLVCIDDGSGPLPVCRQLCQVSNPSCPVSTGCGGIVGYDDIGACIPL